LRGRVSAAAAAPRAPRRLAGCACAARVLVESRGERNARSRVATQFGVLILTTSAGIMDHEEARRKKVGGKVLGFVY
jgi:Ribosomal protein S8